jgi:pyruvate kinase
LKLDADFTGKTFGRIDQSIAMGALFTAHHLGAKAIVAMTDSGSTALWMSRHRIHIPIYALTPSWPRSARWRCTATCAPC